MGDRTKGTRVGNGPGWGGPANGVNKRFAPANNANPKGRGAEPSPARIANAEECYARITTVLRSEDVLDKYPAATIRAGEALLNRIEGTPVQRTLNVNLEEQGADRRKVVEALKALDPEALDAAEEALRVAGVRLSDEG